MTLPQHHNNRARIYFCDPLPRWGVISPTTQQSSYTICQKGGKLEDICFDYVNNKSNNIINNNNNNTNEKSNYHHHHNEIPILKSTYTIHISYTPLTYFITWLAIMTSLHTLFSLSSTSSSSRSHTFPPIFVLFHMLFQISHLVAHLFGILTLERFCVVYGTSLYWTGWLMGTFVFKSERLPLDFTVIAFWLLMLERRNAWGLIQWEFASQLEDTSQDQPIAFGNTVRLITYRIWTIFGVGLTWACIYLPLATHDGYLLSSLLLNPMNLIRWYFATIISGLGMICYWSFWTFQYRGVVWQRELRKGIAVWYSDGIARAADII